MVLAKPFPSSSPSASPGPPPPEAHKFGLPADWLPARLASSLSGTCARSLTAPTDGAGARPLLLRCMAPLRVHGRLTAFNP
jgi:hypothetical protein